MPTHTYTGTHTQAHTHTRTYHISCSRIFTAFICFLFAIVAAVILPVVGLFAAIVRQITYTPR